MRIWKILSWVVSTTITLAALILAAVAIWAITGTRDLSEYNKYVENSINARLSGQHVKIGKTTLSWHAIDELMALNVNDVALIDNANNQIAYFPKVILRYNFLSLIQAQLTPSIIRLVQPQIDLSGMDLVSRSGGKIDLNRYNLDKFDKIIIQDGSLTTPEGEKWNVRNANLRYDDGFVYLDAAIAKMNSNEAVTLKSYTNIEQTDKGVSATLANFDSFELRSYIAKAAKAHLVMNGELQYVSNIKKNLANFDLTSVTGDVDDRDLFDDKFTIKDGKIAGSYDFNNHGITISDVQMGFADGFKVNGKGTSENFKAFNINVDVANLPISSLVKYWPKTVSLDAIPWLKQRVSAGIITGAKAIVKISSEEVANHKVAKNSVNVKFTFKDIDLKYSDKLTDVKYGAGSGVMDGDSIKVTVDSGISGNTKVVKAIAEIRDIGGPAEKLYVTASAQGDVADLAEFYLNTGSGNKIIANKADVGGSAISDSEIELPMLKNLRLDDVKYHVKSKIINGAAKNLVGQFDATNINCVIEADNNSYHVIGQAVATYNKPLESFALTSAPVNYDISSQNDNLRIAVASDITNSTITLAPLEIVKKAGEQGKLEAEINSKNGQKPELTKFMLDSNSVKIGANGNLTLDYNGIYNMQISKLQFGKTDITGRLTTMPSLTAELKGSSFDMQPLLRYLKTKKDSNDNSEYRVFLQADNLILMNQQSLKNAEISIHCAKIGCDTFSLNAHDVAINQSGGSLTAKVGKAGDLLNGFGLYENMVDGQMIINAKVAGKSYDGTITITDFYIVKARVLARMLTLGSLTGIADTVAGHGIRFKKLSSDVRMDPHNVSVANYKMVGPAIGITANGAINRDNSVVSVTGNIIPAYTANTLLGRIPLIGEAIFSDEGVFALAYAMKGNMDNPDLSVNPLTVLAPGALRRIFE